ncbi:hypothetical protein D3C84_1193690 [compost metagenome]
METKAMTVSDVASTDWVVKLVYRWSAGTMTKPPPTPSNPDRTPATMPEAVSAHAQGPVQFSLPRFSSRTQGGGLRAADAFAPT